MRWILTLAALASAAWFLSNRQRRDRLQSKAQDVVPPAAQSWVANGASSLRNQSTSTVDNLTETVKSTTDTVTQQAQSIASTAQEAVGNAVSSAQQASGAMTDQVGQSVESARESAAETTQSKDASRPPVDTPPSVHDTVQAELTDIGAQQEHLRAQTELPPDPAEKSGGGAFGVGSLSHTEMQTAQVPAGHGVSAIAADGDGTSAGAAGASLTPGTSAESTDADTSRVPTTGMDQAPVIDRAAQVGQRTSGDFIGNKKKRVYHAADSSHLPDEDNRVYFQSADEAEAAGFRPAEGEVIPGRQSK